MRSVLLHEGEYVDELAALRANADVVSVDLDRTRAVEAAPSDTSYADQWALPQVGWDQLYGTVGIAGSAIVAVLDTGVDAAHQDLDGVVLPGTSILDGSNGQSDPNGHGTWMAGIIAAETDNGFGVAGTAYAGVSILPVTVLGADGTGQDSDIIAGVVYAADADADVILMSFSNPGYSPALQAAIDYAWNSGAVLVAATGNDGSSTATFPAGDRGVIGVTSTDSLDTLAVGANYGPAAFMAAPGVDIATTSSGGGVASISGTSAAAAAVAGAAALLSANEPLLSNGVIVSRLARTADPAGDPAQTGNGRLNLARAMADASTDSIQPAGAAPVGAGGPHVGPYVAAASRFAGVVTPNSVTGGSTNNYTFTLTAANGSNGATVSLTVPTGWTAPTVGAGGNVTLGAGTCAVTNLSVSGMTISVSQPSSGNGCNNNTTVIFNYSNAVAPNPAVTTAYTFAVSPRQDPNDAQPVVTVSANVNDAPTDIALNDQLIAENAGPNAEVGTLTTTDPDVGNTHTYTLVAGTGADDNAAFNILGDSLRANASFNFEADSSYTVRIRTTDGGGLFYEEAFTITVTNVNETPTDIVLNDQSIAENAGPNAEVGTLTTTDPDVGNTHTYTLVAGTGADDNAAFNILGDSLRANASFNFEADSSYTVRIRTTDGGGLFYEEAFTITVTNVNEAPVADDETLTATEDTTLDTSATTLLTGDTDVDSAILTVTAVANPIGGTATLMDNLTPLNPADDFVRFVPNANLCGAGAGSYDYTVSDGSLTDIGHVTVDIICVNDAPVLDLDGAIAAGVDNNAAFTEGQLTPATLAPDATVSDVDDANLESALITLANPLDGSFESLAADALTCAPISITAYNGLTGELALSGSASKAMYQACLRSVAYDNTDQDPDATDRVIEWTISDGSVDSDLATTTLSVTPVNDAPEASADTVTAIEDTILDTPTADLLANDTDAESDSLFVSAVLNPSNGTVSLIDAGVLGDPSDDIVRFSPDADVCDPIGGSYQYTVSDGLLTDDGPVTVKLLASTTRPASPRAPTRPCSKTPARRASPAGRPPSAPARPTSRARRSTSSSATTTTACSRAQPAIAANGTLTYTPAANANGIGHRHGPDPRQRRHRQRRRRHQRRADLHHHRHRGQRRAAASPRAPTRRCSRTPAPQSVDRLGDRASAPARPTSRARPLTSSSATTTTACSAAQPAIAADGTLTYTPAANANGTATVTVQLARQRRHRQRRRRHQSPRRPSPSPSPRSTTRRASPRAPTRPCSRTPVRRPSPAGRPPSAPARPTSRARSSTSSSATTTTRLFSAQPAIAANGTLTYTPAANANGIATVTVADPRQRRHRQRRRRHQRAADLHHHRHAGQRRADRSADGSTSQLEDAAPISIDLRTLVGDVETADGDLVYSIVSGVTAGDAAR